MDGRGRSIFKSMNNIIRYLVPTATYRRKYQMPGDCAIRHVGNLMENRLHIL